MLADCSPAAHTDNRANHRLKTSPQTMLKTEKCMVVLRKNKINKIVTYIYIYINIWAKAFFFFRFLFVFFCLYTSFVLIF